MRRHWITLVLSFIFAFGFVSALNVYNDIGRPFGGFIVGLNHSRNTWSVNAATPSWWRVGQLRYEDVIVALEAQRFTAESFRVYEGKESPSRVGITVLRGENQINLDLDLQRFSLANFFDIKLPDIITGLGFWLLAIAVYRVRPDETVNRVFALATSFVAASIWLTINSIFPESTHITRALDLVWVGFASFIGVLTLHLATVFPHPMHRSMSRLIALLYIAMTVIGLLYALSLPLRWSNETALSNTFSSLGNVIVNNGFGLSVLFYLARLFFLVAQPNVSKRIRRQATFLLLGISLALPYIIVINVRTLSANTGSYFWNDLDLRYLALAAPIAFAFGILRYQTFQRTHAIVIAAFILVSSALFASVGAWFMRLVEPRWVNSLNWSPFTPLFFAALLSGIFWSLQNSWRGAFRRVFNWEARSYNAARLFGQDLATQTNIAHSLVKRLELERSALWIWDDHTQEFRLATRDGDWRSTVTPSLRPDPSTKITSPLRILPFTDSIPLWLQPLRASSLEIIVPLVVAETPVGLLGLGKRWDEEIFDERDLEIVELIAQQAALFLITAKHIEQLRQVPNQIAIAQEREQFKIAQELHDTVQQFLGRLPFYLETSRTAPRDESDSIIQRCIADAESAAHAVRQIRNSLAPLQLEQSLSQPLTLLVERFRARTKIETLTDLPADLDSHLSPEMRHALYRVIQQALDNIIAHAHASRVIITLAPVDGRLNFAVSDNGVGSTEESRAEKISQGSFGLASMQARITSLGGEFEIQSSPNGGTTVSGWLPI
ncbi:MAG: GAF domain-containing protein [Chloroflexi bacterium]|nr:GAF domain-containing protein [Chloroflexota bacterium]